jgi:hypothetical protein
VTKATVVPAAVRMLGMSAAHIFARGEKHGREQRPEEDAHRRPDQALFDRVLDEEDAAEHQRHAADPDHPARAEALLESAGLWSRRLDRRRRGLHG